MFLGKFSFEKIVSEEANNIFHDIVKDILQRSCVFCQKKIHFFLDDDFLLR